MGLACTVCHTANREERRFCKQCGAALALRCAACGFDNLAGESYCGGCGRALANPFRSAPSVTNSAAPTSDFKVRSAASERRQITVMFCDLVGATALTTRLDPEDMRDLIRAYQALCHSLIIRYDGRIARFVGDGVMAYFGYPLAHEDDAERAVRAGLGIVRTVPELQTALPASETAELAVRIGIATGLVVAGDLIGDGASEQNAVVGSTPYLAARLQTAAASNSVVVADTTKLLLGRTFDFKDLGNQHLNGIDVAVRVWSVDDSETIRTRFTAAKSERLTPVVGRDADLDQLFSCWNRARAGRGQVVLIHGHAGIGKSRIAEEFHRRVRSEQPTRIIYQCSPHHTNSPLHPFTCHLERAEQYVTNNLHIDIHNTPIDEIPKTVKRVRKARQIFDRILHDSRSERMSNGIGPRQRKQHTVQSLIDLYTEMSSEEAVFTMFEDAQWIDPTSMDFLDSIIDCLDRARIMLVITYRPDFTAPPHWLTYPYVTEIALDRLSDQHGLYIVDRITGDKSLPPELPAQIVGKCDGIPLFVEELTKAIMNSNEIEEHADRFTLKSPHSPVHIPSTLHDSLMARLDRLGKAKELAQIGAAIGREFSYEMLSAVCESPERTIRDGLARLIDADLISQQDAAPQESFIFKHALVQDEAYASLLRTTRRQLHSRIAHVLTAGLNVGPSPEPEEVAHHYSAAGMAPEAAQYWERAAGRALERSAFREVIGHARRGLELLPSESADPTQTESELRLQILLGAAYGATCGFAGHDTEQAFLRADQLSSKAGDATQRIDALRGLYTCNYTRGDLSTAHILGQRMLDFAATSNDPRATTLGHYMLGACAFWRGEYTTARKQLELGAITYAPQQKKSTVLAAQIDIQPTLYAHLAWTLWISGRPDQAIGMSDKAISTAQDLTQPFSVALALFWACVTRICCGQTDVTQTLASEMMALSTEYDFAYFRSVVTILQGHSAIIGGDHEIGLQQVQSGLDEINRLEAGIGLPWVMSIAAAAHLKSGRYCDGLDAIDNGLLRINDSEERHWEAELHRLRGELYLAVQSDRQTEAEDSFRAALDIASQQGARSLQLRAALSLTGFNNGMTAPDDALDLLARCYTEYREGFGTTDLIDAEQVLRDAGKDPTSLRPPLRNGHYQ